MTAAQRARAMWLVGPALGALVVWGVTGLPPFGAFHGAIGELLDGVTVAERRALNVVTAIVFDYRGFDTMGEEFILFAAVAGVAMLLRLQRDEDEGAPKPDAQPGRMDVEPSAAVRALTLALVGAAVLVGVYVVAHGQLTPGGGFQGGVILATAPLLVYLADEVRTLQRITPEALVEVADAVGASVYVLVGSAGLVAGREFLSNVVPLGQVGSPLSGGTIAVLNAGVGLEVSAAFILLVNEFLRQALEVRERR